MILDGIAAIKFLLSGQFSHFIAVFKAHIAFYAILPTTLNKRKLLKKQVKKYTTTAVYLHSIVADFYINGKKTFTEIDRPERFKSP